MWTGYNYLEIPRVMSGGKRKSPRKSRNPAVGESGDTRLIRRASFTVEDVFFAFSAREQPVGRILKKWEHDFFHSTIGTGTIHRKYPRVQTWALDILGPPITVQPVSHSILSTGYFFSWNVKWIQPPWDPSSHGWWQAKEPEKIKKPCGWWIGRYEAC